MGTETFEMRTDSVSHLSAGDIWATRRRSVFVVLSVRSAQWRGEECDVYAHIDQWLTCRPATQEESELWSHAVAVSAAWKAHRKSLGVNTCWEFRDGMLHPSFAATQRLDSYDDRWEPPHAIALTVEQIAVESERNESRAALHDCR